MKTDDERYMRLALEQAELALKNDWIPVGAVFVKDGHVVTHGRKNGITHSLFDHAEHNGCYQALWSRDCPNLKGFTVYSTLEPCLLCMSMLMTTRVSHVVYGFEDPYGGGAFLLSRATTLPERYAAEQPTVEGGLLRAESKELLRQFFLRQSDAKRWSDRDNPLVKAALA